MSEQFCNLATLLLCWVMGAHFVYIWLYFVQAFINFVLPAVWYLQELYAVFDNESDILYDESGTFSSLMSTFLPQRYLYSQFIC